MRGMRNAYYARDNFDVRRGGRGFSCAVKNTLISQNDAVDTRTFRVKPNTPKLLSMPGKNGGQLWDLPSISMVIFHSMLTSIVHVSNSARGTCSLFCCSTSHLCSFHNVSEGQISAKCLWRRRGV